jgi:hypothetical protein
LRRSLLVKIAEPHRSKVAQAITQGRAQQEVAQGHEDRLQRLRDEMVKMARNRQRGAKAVAAGVEDRAPVCHVAAVPSLLETGRLAMRHL